MNKLFIFVLFALIATTLAINVRVAQTEPVRENGILPTCMICSYVIDRIDGYLQDHTNTTEIVAKVEHDCEKLKENKWVTKCDSITQQYLGEIITLLEEKKSAEVICKIIALC